MTQTEHAILEALRELERAAKTGAVAGAKPHLLPLFARLEELARALPRESHPDLLHYLHRKSYEKARLWIEGQDARNARGTCPH